MKCELKWILYERKMTQGELAKRVGMTNATMTKIVRGGETYLSTAKKIAKELNLTIEEIWP